MRRSAAAAIVMLLWVMGAAAAAAPLPSFDPAVHPYVQIITTDKALYAPGSTGHVLLTLRNPKPSGLAASVVTTIYLDSSQIAQATNSVTVPASGTLSLAVPFALPDDGDRGYRVDIAVRNGDGEQVDEAAGAIDVQSSAMASRFPRPCWVSHWDGAIDAASTIAALIVWHCNTVQAYALYYRPEAAPPATLPRWPSLSRLDIERSTIADIIAAAHGANMPVGFFQATGEAYDDWSASDGGPSLDMGSFRRRCTPSEPCGEADMDRSPPPGRGWNSPPQNYGWVADHLDLFNLCDERWRRALVENSIRPMFKQFAFDFWQADTLGAPTTILYDADGHSIDTGACLSNFASAAQTALQRPVIVNTVSGWESTGVAASGTLAYQYRETWNYDAPSYRDIDDILSNPNHGLRRYGHRAVVMPAYLDRTLAVDCATHAKEDGCTVNGNSYYLATAMFAIAGSTLMDHADDGCVVTNVFIEGPQLGCSSKILDGLLAYKAFEVGYESMLRDGVANSDASCAITAGARGGASGAAGEVYVLGKVRAGFQICHLLNLTGVTSADWSDLDGTKETPTPLSMIAMKLHYAGDEVEPGRNKLWWASPDTASGAAQSLRYTVGSDADGHYVRFMLPSLAYWDMIVLETRSTNANRPADARQSSP